MGGKEHRKLSLILIATNHTCIDYQEPVDGELLIVDTRNALEGFDRSWARFGMPERDNRAGNFTLKSVAANRP